LIESWSENFSLDIKGGFLGPIRARFRMGFVSCQSKLAEYLLSEWPLLPSGGRKRRRGALQVSGVKVRGLQIDQPNVLSVEVIVCTTAK